MRRNFKLLQMWGALGLAGYCIENRLGGEGVCMHI
jgi:hypothetical protein